MKKIFLVVLVIVAGMLLINSAKAQETSVREALTVGVKGGLNLSNVYDTRAQNFSTDAKAGFVGGGFVHIPIGKFLGIQPEVLYAQKGFRASGGLLGNTYEFTRTSSYIDVPVLVAFKPVELLTIVAGPQYSYLVRQRDEFVSSSMSVLQEQEFKNDNIRKNIFCLTGGADLNLAHLVVGARVGWDVQHNNGDGTATNPRYKNVWYQATIGYRFY